MSIFDEIQSSIAGVDEAWKRHPAYYLFEPFDVPERSRETIELAAKDGVDLFAPDFTRCLGQAPYGFQCEYILSEHFGRVIMAGSQLGKSAIVLIEILASATGEIPIALRYPKGHDTGIPREITDANIIRWGRRSKDTGAILDHNVKARRDDTWNCGTVIGVGCFPASKIVPPGSMMRLASYQSMILQNWWPAFTGERESQLAAFVPKLFIDRSSGSAANPGFKVQEYVVHLLRGVSLKMLTYEGEKRGFEGVSVPTWLDEEPPKEDIMGAVFTHCTRWSLSETPWRGITFSKALAFPKEVSSQKKLFHCAAYDSPYMTPERLRNMRSELESRPWEIGARMWGIPTSLKDDPYYDRRKVNLWVQRAEEKERVVPCKLVNFEPTQEWNGIRTDDRISKLPGLLDVQVQALPVRDDDERGAWRIYEDRTPGVAYVAASDQGEGAAIASDAGDRSACVIGRPRDDDPTKPVIVATLRSTLPTAAFAVEVLYAARYFNNALLAPETGQGAQNEAFRITAQDWPYWFRDITKRQSTRKAREVDGFCPTVDRREVLFNTLIREWVDSYDEGEYPEIPDERILREIAEAVKSPVRNKTAFRCDHPAGGSSDMMIAFGILLFAFQKEYMHMIRCNDQRNAPSRKTWMDVFDEHANMQTRQPVGLGEVVTKMR